MQVVVLDDPAGPAERAWRRESTRPDVLQDDETSTRKRHRDASRPFGGPSVLGPSSHAGSLDDEPGDDVPSHDHAGIGGPDDPHAPPRRRLARWWPLAGAAAVAVAVGLVVDTQSERRFAERVAEVPGLVAPVDGPVHELWRAPGSSVEGAVLPLAASVVTVSRSATATSVAARDWSTGALLWSVRVAPGLRGAFEGGGTVCPTPVDGVATDALCIVSPDRPLYAGQGRRPVTGVREDGSTRVPSRRGSEVRLLAGADGSTLGTWKLGAQVFAVARVADDLVVARLLDDGRTSVERRAGKDGALLWERVSAARIDSTAVPTLAAVVSADVVAVEGADRAVLDVADGTELEVVAVTQPVAVAPAADGYATWSPIRGGRLVAKDGTTTVVPGLPPRLAADDGSTGGRVLLATGPEVYAVDPGTGVVAWHSVTQLDPALVASGTVVTASDDGVGAIDADDGTVLWSVDTRTLVSPPLSDGAVVLTAETDGLGGGVIEARGLRTGVRYWQVDLPRGTRWIDAMGGRLVASTQDEVVVLG